MVSRDDESEYSSITSSNCRIVCVLGCISVLVLVVARKAVIYQQCFTYQDKRIKIKIKRRTFCLRLCSDLWAQRSGVGYSAPTIKR